MISQIASHLHDKLTALNFWEKCYCYVVIKKDNTSETAPAEYAKQNGNWKTLKWDAYNGQVYLRKNGVITISKDDNTISACSDDSVYSIPLRLVSTIKKTSVLESVYDDETVSIKITNALNSGKGNLKSDIGAKKIDFSIQSIHFTEDQILEEEFSSFTGSPMQYSIVAVDFLALVTISKSCVQTPCSDYA